MIRGVAEAAVGGLSPVEIGYGIVVALLGGGVFKFAESLWTSRGMSKRTNVETDAIAAKLPVEIDSLAVQGAEAAVIMMKTALDSATTQLATLQQSFTEFREETRTELAEEHRLRVKAVRRVEQVTKVLIAEGMKIPPEDDEPE